MTAHDPLCPAHPHSVAGGRAECLCLLLRTARLQGPVRDNRHAAICWCAECLPTAVQS